MLAGWGLSALRLSRYRYYDVTGSQILPKSGASSVLFLFPLFPFIFPFLLLFLSLDILLR
jgi:hypothetical protein